MPSFVDCITITNGKQASLERTIESVRRQTHVYWRHIIIVDRNNQLHCQLEQEFRSDRRYSIFCSRRPVRGYQLDHVVFLRNMALQHIRHNFAAFLDHDDEWDCDHLRLLLAEFGQAAAVISGVRIYHKSGLRALLDARCPWATTDEAAKEQFARFADIGVYERGSNVAYPFVYQSSNDVQVYLFTSAILYRAHELLSRRFVPSREHSQNWGESHDLIHRIIRSGRPVKALRVATVSYQLGGFSQPLRPNGMLAP
ncbi:glycosyltransferase family A protein [Falsiroseomonas oryzae]|uniref:glycosyltransferase family A protein n=1 Tax=Falsiroseomonas oryzae TaxID=2766473 RepID=UPI0038CBF6A9